MKNPDFGAVASAVGLHGERVENAADIRPAIERALPTQGQHYRLRDGPAGAGRAAAHDHRRDQGLRPDDRQLVFTGDFAEAWEQAKSNIRDIGQAL